MFFDTSIKNFELMVNGTSKSRVLIEDTKAYILSLINGNYYELDLDFQELQDYNLFLKNHFILGTQIVGLSKELEKWYIDPTYGYKEYHLPCAILRANLSNKIISLWGVAEAKDLSLALETLI